MAEKEKAERKKQEKLGSSNRKSFCEIKTHFRSIHSILLRTAASKWDRLHPQESAPPDQWSTNSKRCGDRRGRIPQAHLQINGGGSCGWIRHADRSLSSHIRSAPGPVRPLVSALIEAHGCPLDRIKIYWCCFSLLAFESGYQDLDVC